VKGAGTEVAARRSGVTTTSNSGGSSSSIRSGPTSSAAADTAARDQGPASTGRVCSWCGKASQQLLRCARCKAAWYCGADHQRAAWKAGHKQECGKAVNVATGAVGELGASIMQLRGG
jgi:hypothetical protein